MSTYYAAHWYYALVALGAVMLPFAVAGIASLFRR